MYALDALLRTVPTDLVDEATHKRLRLAGDQLPDAMAAGLGLEARLGPDPRVDLLLCAATRRQLAVLAGADQAVRLAAEVTAHPGWAGTARLAARSLRLLDNGSPLAARLWLEFDLTDPDRAPVPAVFAAATPTGGRHRPEPAGWDVPGTVTEIVATAAVGGPDAAGLGPVLRRIVDAGILVKQVGLFPGRSAAGVRLLCAATPDPDRLPGALTRCGWTGHRARLTRWMHRCAALGGLLHLDIDLTPTGPLPTVGIEMSYPGAPQPSEEPRWSGLLAVLQRTGLCTAAKRAAVERLGADFTVNMITDRRYRQGLHHVKVAVPGNGPESAKVYFGAYEAGD